MKIKRKLKCQFSDCLLSVYHTSHIGRELARIVLISVNRPLDFQLRGQISIEILHFNFVSFL